MNANKFEKNIKKYIDITMDVLKLKDYKPQIALYHNFFYKLEKLYCNTNKIPNNKDKKISLIVAEKHLYNTIFMNFIAATMNISFYHSIGDIIGHYNGEWELNYGVSNNEPNLINEILYDFFDMGGINGIEISLWKSSPISIMYLETCQMLLTENKSIKDFAIKLKKKYINCIDKLKGREIGNVHLNMLEKIKELEGHQVPYDKNAISAIPSTRTICFGFAFVGESYRENMVNIAIETCRITHNSATAILAAVTSALFVSFGVEKIPIEKWAFLLIDFLKKKYVEEYIKSSIPEDFESFQQDKIFFIAQWEKYIILRFKGKNIRQDQIFLKNPIHRFRYLTENFSKGNEYPGSNGDDAIIMAYDALIHSNGIFEKLVIASILHTGNSPIIGSLALSWYGAYYSSTNDIHVVERLFNSCENNKKIKQMTRESIDYYAYYFYVNLHVAMNTKNTDSSKLDD
jgi:ADP-ribosylglycohydrolase